MDKMLGHFRRPLLLNTPARERAHLVKNRPVDMPMSPMTGKPYSADCYFKMMIIGVGYLFPMCALFAAFDYWKILFVDREKTIEFDLMIVYQSCSVTTVIALSIVESMDMHLRIVGGFVGQFIALLFISMFPLLSEFVPSEILYYVLLILTCVMAIATGFLDSALLCFNSQYSPRMQEALQIGIGCSIFASVIYRDITKMVGSNITESSIIYFICSLMTVLACLWNYISLLRHPVSWPIRTSAVFRGDFSGDLVVAGFGGDEPLLEAVGNSTPKPTVLGVLGKCWKNQLVVFVHFLFCSLGYPAMITAIPLYSGADTFLGKENWYQAILLTLFTIADTVSRFGVRCRFNFTPKTFWKSIIVRAALIPLLWMAACGTMIHSDLFSVVAVILFGITNGYCISLSLIIINEIPGMNIDELAVAGRFSAVSVNLGLCVGGIIAAAFSRIVMPELPSGI